MDLIQISQSLLSILIFLVPLFFTTATPEFYATNKFALLILTVPILFFLWTLSMTRRKQVVFSLNKLNLPVLLFGAAYIVSTIVVPPNKVESFADLTGTGVVVALVLLYFLITNLEIKKEQVVYPLLASSLVLALLYLGQFLGILEKVVPFEIVKNNQLFTPAGTLVSLVFLLSASLPLAVEEALGKDQRREATRSLLGWLATLIVGAGLVVSLISFVRDVKPNFLPYSTSWAVAVDSLRTIRTGIFGVGPANYINAFTQGKPLTVNNTNLWMVRFGNSSSFVLQLLTEVGLFGFVAFLLIFANVVKGQPRLNRGQAVFVALLLVFILHLVLPGSLVSLFVLFLILAIAAQKIETGKLAEQSILLPRLFTGAAIVCLLVSYWFGWKWYRAENFFRESILAAFENKGFETYDAQIKAIQTNPYIDRYRVSYSQTNLALASAIAQKGDLSDQDRADISTLVQQAIREAKIATSLNPQKAGNWENLAIIYRNLINATEGASDWAIASYNQAVNLDPFNPLLRLDLGGVFYSLKNYEAAIQQFSIAVNLKPDWANAHYNLSVAFREKGDIERAFAEMQNTLALVDPNSNDFGKASAELEELRRKLPAPPKVEGGEPETLTEPSERAVEVKPKIELPKEEAAPEIPEREEASPTASPTQQPLMD